MNMLTSRSKMSSDSSAWVRTVRRIRAIASCAESTSIIDTQVCDVFFRWLVVRVNGSIGNAEAPLPIQILARGRYMCDVREVW